MGLSPNGDAARHPVALRVGRSEFPEILCVASHAIPVTVYR
jgi:hypothetical protein